MPKVDHDRLGLRLYLALGVRVWNQFVDLVEYYARWLRGKAATAIAVPDPVLVVDDDTSMLRAIARLLRADCFKVLTFQTPTLLLAASIPKSNACLVLDVNLPEMDGAALYEALAAAGCRLPVIMITGRHDSKTQRLINRVKAVDVLFKPFDDTAFLEVISRALSLTT